MSYQVLARKWRPKSFATLIGQEHVVRALSHALATADCTMRGCSPVRAASARRRFRASSQSAELRNRVTPNPAGNARRVSDRRRPLPHYVEMDRPRPRRRRHGSAAHKGGLRARAGGNKDYMIDEVHMLTGSVQRDAEDARIRRSTQFNPRRPTRRRFRHGASPLPAVQPQRCRRPYRRSSRPVSPPRTCVERGAAPSREARRLDADALSLLDQATRMAPARSRKSRLRTCSARWRRPSVRSAEATRRAMFGDARGGRSHGGTQPSFDAPCRPSHRCSTV